jgi:hypothetical protein
VWESCFVRSLPAENRKGLKRNKEIKKEEERKKERKKYRWWFYVHVVFMFQ